MMLRYKELRLAKKLSQDDVAKYLGVTQQAYANYERGARKPDPDTLLKLADFFEVTVDYLLGRDEVPVALSRPGGYDDLTEEEKAQIDGLIDMILKRKEK